MGDENNGNPNNDGNGNHKNKNKTINNVISIGGNSVKY
jgi:hypothetical protein